MFFRKCSLHFAVHVELILDSTQNSWLHLTLWGTRVPSTCVVQYIYTRMCACLRTVTSYDIYFIFSLITTSYNCNIFITTSNLYGCFFLSFRTFAHINYFVISFHLRSSVLLSSNVSMFSIFDFFLVIDFDNVILWFLIFRIVVLK